MTSIWRQEQADIPRVGHEDKLTKGPVVDTAASISVVNRRDSKHLKNKYKLHKPEEIKSATGTTTVTAREPYRRLYSIPAIYSYRL